MAINKDRSLSTRKQAVGRMPWPNLPQPLLNSIAKNPQLLQQISYPGTIKSWASSTRRCKETRHPECPQLLDSEGCKWSSLSKTLPHFINIFFKTENYPSWYHGGRIPCNFWNAAMIHFVGYSCGNLIQRGPNPSHLEIFQASTRFRKILSPWDVNIPFKFAAVNSSPESRIVMAVVTGVSSPAVVAYRYDEVPSPWFKFNSREINSYDAGCREIDPYGANKQFMRFTNLVSFEGKFYALRLQGTLAVVEEKDSGLVITAIGANRAVPWVPAKYFKEYLFESDGEILLAFLIYQTRLPIVDKVEVFRLNTCKLSWMKVESLQEKALFLENECCIWVKSRQVGCRGNCVYISAQGEGNEWCIYDMETGSISPSLVAASLPWMNHYDSIPAM